MGGKSASPLGSEEYRRIWGLIIIIIIIIIISDCKNRYKVYYQRHRTTFGRAQPEAVVFISEKLGGNIYPEGKGMSILFNEEACSREMT